MKKISISLFLIVIFILAGCNVLGSPPDPKKSTQPTNTPVRWYPRPATATPIPTVTQPAQIPMTGGLFAPPVSVDIPTNCRRGPSADYEVLLAFMPGQNGIVLGKYDPSNYYLIRTDTGHTCWLWGQNATIEGAVNNIPDMPPPALFTNTPEPPIQAQYEAPQMDTPMPTIAPPPTGQNGEPPPTKAPPEPKPTKAPKCKFFFCFGDGGGGGGGGRGGGGNGHGKGPGGLSPILLEALNNV